MRISVVIPCYNAAPFLGRTLASVQSQTRPPDEIIIVDDGSTDDSVDVARRACPYAHVLTGPNRGVSQARNAGVARATGNVIAFLDADDAWESIKLDLQANYLALNPEVMAVTCGMRKVSHDGRLGDAVIPTDAATKASSSLEFLGSPKVPNLSCLMVRTATALSIAFPPGIGDAEDLIYLACLRRRGLIGAVEVPLVQLHQHSTQRTRTTNMFARGISARLTWCESGWIELGAASLDEARDAVLNGAATEVVNAYWRRDTREYRRLRAQLLSLWPPATVIPGDLRHWAIPSVFLRLKDRFVKGARANQPGHHVGPPHDGRDPGGTRGRGSRS